MRRLFQPVKSFTAVLLLGGIATWPAVFPRRSSPQAPTPAWACSVEQVALRTGDGVLLDGVLYHPIAAPRSSAILLVHGFGSNFYSAYFPPFARAAVEQGYATLALNMRDHDAGPKV